MTSRWAVDEIVNSTQNGPVAFPLGISASIASNVRASEGAGTTVLTSSDLRSQIFNLSANRIVRLPSTGVPQGDTWEIINPNPFQLIIKANDSTNIVKTWGAGYVLKALIANPLTATDWVVVSSNVIFGRSWQDFAAVYGTGAAISTTLVNKWKRVTTEDVAVYNQLIFAGGGGATPFKHIVPTYFSYDPADFPDGSTLPVGKVFTLQGNPYFGFVNLGFSTGNQDVIFETSYNIADSGGTRFRQAQSGDFNAAEHYGFEYTFKALELKEV